MGILVLGAGNVGRAIALDLSEDFDVTVADLKAPDLSLPFISLDATRFNELVKTIGRFDLVIDALPGRLGYAVVKAVIKAGRDLVDVSFMPENPMGLGKAAEDEKVSVVFDAGFAPGLSNVLMGRIWAELDEFNEGRIMVGGLPKEPRPPLYYRLTWSPTDLMEEYTRPARVIRDGEITHVDPLEKIERVSLRGMEFEAFLSDGLRSLLQSIRAEKLEEWTLRWPGHLEKMRVLKELGFLRPENVEFTLRVVSPLMRYDSPDFSIMRVTGVDSNGKGVTFTVYDEQRGGLTSMARLTGFTAASVARIVAEGGCTFGVIPPEILGMREDTFERITSELRERGVNIVRS